MGTSRGFFILQGAVQTAVGDTFTMSARFASDQVTADTTIAIGGGAAPKFETVGSGRIDNGDGTVTVWRTITITSLGSGSGTMDPLLTFTNIPPAGSYMLFGDVLIEKSPVLGDVYYGDTQVIVATINRVTPR